MCELRRVIPKAFFVSHPAKFSGQILPCCNTLTLLSLFFSRGCIAVKGGAIIGLLGQRQRPEMRQPMPIRPAAHPRLRDWEAPGAE